MSRKHRHIWGVGLLLEPMPGANISQSIDEALEFVENYGYYNTSTVWLHFNGKCMRVTGRTRDEIVAEYGQ